MSFEISPKHGRRIHYMIPPTFFKASWSTTLKLMTLVSSAVLLGIAAFLVLAQPDPPPGGKIPTGTALFLLIVWIGSALFTVRGYVLTREALLVQRLFWRSAVPLQGLVRASADPMAMSRSLRLFGNGGLFSFSGVFTNPTLGRYRAYATNPAQAVVLELPSRPVVVTPDATREFLGALRALHPGIDVTSTPQA